MLVLAVDTATPASTAVVAEVTAASIRGLADRRTVDARAHGELLAPQIVAALADAGVRAGELAAIVAGLGPGPFTGLRVGLATAAAMGHALAIPTYGVCSLDALGRAAGPGDVLVATDARRREVYWARYRDGVRVGQPGVDRPAELIEQAGQHIDQAGQQGTADRAVGAGAVLYAELLGLPTDPDLLHPPGLELIELAADRIRARAASEILTPLYLRRPDAVESNSRKPVLR